MYSETIKKNNKNQEFIDFIVTKVNKKLKNNSEYISLSDELKKSSLDRADYFRLVKEKAKEYNLLVDGVVPSNVLNNNFKKYCKEKMLLEEKINKSVLRKGKYIKDLEKLKVLYAQSKEVGELYEKYENAIDIEAMLTPKVREIEEKAVISVVKENANNPVVDKVFLDTFRILEKGGTRDVLKDFITNDDAQREIVDRAICFICEEVEKILAEKKYRQDVEEMKRSLHVGKSGDISAKKRELYKGSSTKDIETMKRSLHVGKSGDIEEMKRSLHVGKSGDISAKKRELHKGSSTKDIETMKRSLHVGKSGGIEEMKRSLHVGKSGDISAKKRELHKGSSTKDIETMKRSLRVGKSGDIEEMKRSLERRGSNYESDEKDR